MARLKLSEKLSEQASLMQMEIRWIFTPDQENAANRRLLFDNFQVKIQLRAAISLISL